ncbi:MAG: CHAT domain-containing protein [Bacteroidales bacterium]|nr:CHAT domain-containing protein [Bacteroidales bacterium]
MRKHAITGSKHISLFGLLFFMIIQLQVYSQEFTSVDTIIASEYIVKAERFIDELSVDSAEFYYLQAQKIYDDANNIIGYIKASNGLGEAYNRNNKLVKGLLLLQKTQKIIIENIGDSNFYLADNYNKTAIGYYFMSDFKESLKYLNLSLELKLKILAPNHSSIGDSYNNIGVMHDMLGEKEKAINAYLKALEIIKSAEIINNIDLANTQENIAILYFDLSKYDLALKYEKEVCNIFYKEFGDNHLKYLNSYELIGVVLFNMERYKQAELILKDVFEKKQKILLPHNPYMINSFINVGNLYFIYGNVSRALKYHLKAYEFLEAYSENEINYAFIDLFNNIGNDYNELAQHELAIEYYNKAYAIAHQIFGKNHIIYSSYFNNIAIAHTHQKKYNLAIEYLYKAEKILLKNKGSEKTLLNIYSNLAVNYFHDKKPEKSKEYFNKAVQLAIKLYGNNSPSLATIYGNIGTLYHDSKDFINSSLYFEKSLKIRKENFGIKHPDVASAYVSYGLAYFENEVYDTALLCYQHAYIANLPEYKTEQSEEFENIILNPTLDFLICPDFEIPYNYFELIRTNAQKLSVFEMLYFKTNDIKYLHPAYDLYFFCDTVISEYRKGITKDSDKLILSELFGELYPNASFTCMELFDLTKDSTYLKDAYYFLQKGKSLILIETMNEINARKIAGIPDSLLIKERNITDELSYLQRQLITADKSDIPEIYKSKLNLAIKLDKLTSEFEQNYPKYYDLKYNVKSLSIKEIQSELDENTCILSYYEADYRYLYTMITKDSIEIVTIPVTENFIDTINYFRNSLIYPESGRFKSFYKRNGYNLYKLLFPQNLPESVENIIIIPDHKLSVFPFEALLTSEVTSDMSLSEYPFLIKKYNLTYNYAERLVYNGLKDRAIKEKQYDFIAFAPVFSDMNTNHTSRNTKTILNNIQTDIDTNNVRSRFINRMMISALPGTEEEVKSIYNLFNQNSLSAKVNLYEAADENEVKTSNLIDYKFIHFATHGFANTENPELSGLLLAQDSTDNEDNILFLDEILSIEIDPELVVLSACETGLGKIYKGEGMIGLSRSLIYSGAKNISVSLWKVSDESTQKLMTEFYKNILIDNSGKYGNSLRKAKLNLINSERFSHPFYWSPFILIGN